MKVQNYIKPKDPIQIEIYIPNSVEKGKIENQIIKRNLKLTAGNSNCEVEIEMKILTIPIELLLSCENYKLEFINEYYYLKTNQLFSKEKLVFKIQNYFKSDNLEIQTRIESLEGNTSKEPKIEWGDDTLSVNLPGIENNEAKRINCKIEIYISQNYKIPIIIDSVIMPINYSFQIYDFLSHCFVSNKLELLLPTSNYSYGNFIKYLPNNNIIEIKLNLLISIPYKNKKIDAKIKTENEFKYYGKKNVSFEYEEKKILIDKERTEFTCKIQIDCGNIITDKIGTIICELEGIIHRIEISKKDFNFNNFKLEEIDVYKCHYNKVDKTFRWDKIKESNELKNKGIYVCPFGHWNFNIVEYTLKNQDNYYNYVLNPLPFTNKRFYISEDGIISELEYDKNYNQERAFKSGVYGFRNDNYALFGTCENEWYPLITDYEDDLFETHIFESLKQKYNYYIQKKSEAKFVEYLKNYFPVTYEDLKKELNYYRKSKQSVNDYLNKILNYINQNFYLDILKRFENLKKNYFSFAYFAYLIFEKTKDTLTSFITYLPDCIKIQINSEMTYILNNLDKIEDWDKNKWAKLNIEKYNLILKLYVIFSKKKSEIENNNSTINLSHIDLNLINNKVEELQNKLYLYNPNSKQMTKIDSIGKLAQDIERISQEILKSKEERNKEKELDNNTKIESITADKFLIIDDKIKSVDINTLPTKSINLSDINNKSNSIDEIELEDIIQPNIFSINSLMEYFGSCILKTQMLPAFIRYSFISKKDDQMTKSTNIISELFNLYNVLENHNFSLISPRIEEYQKSFEIMLSKLHNSGVDFSKDTNIKSLLKKLKNNNNNQIQDFIILPEKDKFKIRTSNFEVDENEPSSSTNINTVKKNRILYTKIGIKSIQESQVMNLEYENLKPTPNPNPNLKPHPKKLSEKKPKKKSSVAQNIPQPKAVISQEIQKVFSLLEEPIDNPQSLPALNKPDNKNRPNKGFFKKKDDHKKVVITGKNFEGQNFDVEKETNRVIDKMKNINKKKLKLDEVTEREGKLDKLFYSDKLKEFLKEPIKINENSIINKLLESSEFLSNRIFLTISQLNLLHEIPYKNLEVNILLDCARTIGDEEKFFVILQVCALTTVLYSLEIPYLISVVGDSGFKVVIKELEEEHSIENLQKALDCIFIKRCNTNIASCIKTATDKFKTLDENAHRVFYMFTNGLDEEFALFDQWKDRIFVNPNHSFAFIFSKPVTIKPEQSKFLSEFWDKFGKKCKLENLPVELIEMSKEKLYIIKKNVYEINENNIMGYTKQIINILRRYKDKDNNNKTEKSLFEVNSLPQIQNLSLEDPENNMLSNFVKMIADNTLRDIREEPYIKKIKLPLLQEAVPKINKKEFKEISKNIGSILKVQNPINNDIKNKFRNFIKTFKIRKDKLNLSFLELIFKPNLATQTILTDVGTHIDVNELIKYFLNPTPNPRIYRELGDGFIKNYGVTIIIDSSISCFSPLSNQHTWNTIQILLSALGAIDLPCFDLIITGTPNPFIVCSEKNSLDILSEKSQIWPIIFELLNKNDKNVDLASAIKAAYNLHNSRKSEHPDFLFVVTDGLFSLSERQRIIKNVLFCIAKGLNVFGIGVGISPFGIEKLFPSIVYSLNPDKLIQGIASCFSGASLNNTAMKMNLSGLKISFIESDIEDSQKNPKYKQLKNELMNIPVELSGYDYYLMEIPPDAKEEELTGDGKFSVHNYGMYEKDFFKGQKLLIVMPYSSGMNEGEDERLSYNYITKSSDNSECIQSSIDYTGIQAEVVINYKDAITKLTQPGTKKDCCDYYACIIMSGEPYPELPNPNDDPYLFGQFINVIKQFWENGGGLGLFADNAPFNYQINILIEKLFPNSNFRVAGNHPGMQTIYGDDTGILANNATFNRKIEMIDNYARNIISHSLTTIYEGKTISYFVEKPNDDDLLYYGKNEELKMITDPKLLLPFVPFSKDSDGGFNSVFYSSNDDKGDIVVDCSYTKFFLEMGTKGTPRYIQNIVSWLGAPEKHQQRDKCKDGSDYRPKAIDIQINWNDRWNGFKERPKNLSLPENMKTLFAVDCSGSISGCENYFRKLRELRLKYYNSSRGDKFYTWGSNYYYKNEQEMDSFIASKYGPDGTESYYIAEIGRVTKNENFEHLIIVTDGQVSTYDIDESDRRVQQYGLQYSYVSTYIIGSGGDESVGCPFSRGCPGITYIIDNSGNERQQASLSKEDQNALSNINSINNWDTFNKKYQNLFNAIRAKCLGRNADSDLKNKLNSLKSRVTDAGSNQNDFNTKFNNLFRMADGQIRNVSAAIAA